MTYDPKKHHRHSIRLKDYDYSQNGSYFITICIHQFRHLLGKIINDKMQANDAGDMVEKWWLELENKFSNASIQSFIVMPNHIHGIICIENKIYRKNVKRTFMGQTHRSAPTEYSEISTHIRRGRPVCPPDNSIHLRRGGPACPPDNSIHLRRGGPACPPDNPNIQQMIQWFKTMSTNEYIHGVKSGYYPPFKKYLWQRNYYEHVIRNDRDLAQIYEYIEHNINVWDNPP